MLQGLDSLGYSHISAEQIALFLKKSDSSHSGDLSLTEFMEHLARHEKQLHFVFSSMDSNKSGRVTSAEVKVGQIHSFSLRNLQIHNVHIHLHNVHLQVAFNKLGINIGVEEAEKLVARLDDDNSLDISFEEWRDYLLFHPRLD